MGGFAQYDYEQSQISDAEWITQTTRLMVSFNQCVITYFGYNSGTYQETQTLQVDAVDTNRQSFEVVKGTDTQITFTSEDHDFRLVYDSVYNDEFGDTSNRANFYLYHEDGTDVAFLRYTQGIDGNSLVDATYLDMAISGLTPMTIYLEIDKTQSGNTLQTYTIHGKDGNTVVVTEVTGSGDQNLYNVTGPGCSVSQITATELFTMNYCN